MDVYSIGECVIDFLPGEQPGSYVRNAGGAPANAAIAVARNGLKAGFCGKVGDDDFGRFLQKTLTDEGVELLCPQRTDAAVTTMAFVTLSPEGERSFTFARKPGADMLLAPEEVEEKTIYQIYRDKLGITLGRGRQVIRAAGAVGEVAESLCLPENSPVLRIERRAYDSEKRLVEYMILSYKASKYCFEVELELNQQ